MSYKNNNLYEFGSFRLNPSERLLLRNGQPVRIPPRTFELLLFFVQRSDQIISKEILMQEVWRNTFVEEANITVHISTIRKILAADPEKSASIETFPRIGYRFVGDVEKTSVESEISQTDITNSDIKTTDDLQTREENQGFQPQRNISAGDLAEQTKVAVSQPAFSPNVTAVIKPFPDTNQRNRNNLVIFAAVVILTILLGSAFAFYKFYDSRKSFQKMNISRILDTGKTAEAVVSPDGKYIAHVISDAGQTSLWVKHIATNSSVQLIAPAAINYAPLTFSKEGDYIYFVAKPRDGSKGTLQQIPVLGGEPKNILNDVGSAVSFAPDGGSFTFVRNLSLEETALIIANVNGSGERQLASLRKPQSFSTNGPSWSPDGKFIACPVGVASGERTSNISLFSVEDGMEQQISNQKWRYIDRIAWLPDGSGLIAPAMELTGQEAAQVWFFPFPSGDPQRITNDLNDYGGVSLTADSKTLVTIQSEIRRNIWLVPNGKANQAKSLTDTIPDAYRFLSWTPDKKIIFPSLATGNRDIWIMDDDGGNRKQLTSTPHNDILPVATADGRYIVFASNRNPSGAVNIWRMNIDGTNPVQLTNGSDESQPNPTRDSQSVLYIKGGNDGKPEQQTIWKVSINGGESTQLTTEPSFGVNVSPDGKQFACWYKSENSAPWKAALIPINGGQPTKLLDIPPGSPLRWTLDGNAITYIKTQNGVSNIWSQPVSGEPAHQLTEFTTEQIHFFDWSDDNQLACSRGVTTRSVVSISDFR